MTRVRVEFGQAGARISVDGVSIRIEDPGQLAGLGFTLLRVASTWSDGLRQDGVEVAKPEGLDRVLDVLAMFFPREDAVARIEGEARNA